MFPGSVKLREGNPYDMKKGLINIAILFTGSIIGAIGAMEFAEKEYKKEKQRADKEERIAQKHLKIILVFNEWLKMKQKGKNLADYFKENGYQRIAIYGMGYIGTALMEELDNTGVQVVYGIDQRAASIQSGIGIITMDEPMKDVDIIVITAIESADSIKTELSKKISCPSVSIEEIVGQSGDL